MKLTNFHKKSFLFILEIKKKRKEEAIIDIK